MNLTDFNDWYTLVIGTISSILTIVALDFLESRIQNRRISVTIAVILISVFTITANLAVSKLVTKSDAFRKWLSGDEYIEGFWYEQNRTHSTLMKITFLEDPSDLSISGETYDSTGHCYATFESLKSAYDKRTLFFQYTSYNSRNPGVGHGFDQLQFNNPASSYHGFVFSTSQGKNFPIEGFKINQKELFEFNGFVTAEDKKRFILSRR